MGSVMIVALLLIAQGHFAFPVIQQPVGDPWHVSQHVNEITQFSKATNVTLLAHNYLAGENFSKLDIGDRLFLVREDSLVGYSVYAIDYYETINPTLFRNLETNEVISARSIIQRYYHDTDLTLQTCISRMGNDQWGLMFVVGRKMALKSHPLPK